MPTLARVPWCYGELMTAVTIFRGGRITIPLHVRQALQLKAGDRIQFVEIDPGRFELFAVNQPVTVLKGMFGTTTKIVSIEEMNVTIAARGAAIDPEVKPPPPP